MKLDELKPGQSAYIIDLNKLSSEVRKKLMIMGMLPSTQITLIRRAPLGDPLQVEIRGESFSIRKKVAAEIEVEEVV